MEVLEGVEFVRLRSVEHGVAAANAHAAEDGRSVRLDPRPASHSASWAVQRRLSSASGTLYVLLRGAYGRYLGAPDDDCAGGCLPLPCPCRAAGQRYFDDTEVQAIIWRAVATGGRRGAAVLLHDASG